MLVVSCLKYLSIGELVIESGVIRKRESIMFAEMGFLMNDARPRGSFFCESLELPSSWSNTTRLFFTIGYDLTSPMTSKPKSLV